MAEFEFKCPQCGGAIEADDFFRGQTVECPHCGKGIVVPRGSVPDRKVQLRPVRRETPMSTSHVTSVASSRMSEYERMAQAEARRQRITQTSNLAKNILLLLFLVATGWGAWKFFRGNFGIPSEGKLTDGNMVEAGKISPARFTDTGSTQVDETLLRKTAAKTENSGSWKEKVVVIGNDGKGGGTAFLVKMDGKTYLVTNEHVVRATDEFKRVYLLDGTRLELGSFEIADDRDIVRFEVNGELPAFKLSNETPKTDDKIAIYGNSAGKGAITEERGTIKAVGTFRLEVTAHVVAGNSGSPVVNGNGEVVGIYTYVTRGDSSEDFDMQDSRYKDGRKWAVRFTGVRWVKVDWKEYCDQVALLEDTREFLARMMPFLAEQDGEKTESRFTYGLRYDELTRLDFRIHGGMYRRYLQDLSNTYTQWQNARSEFDRSLRKDSAKDLDKNRTTWQESEKEFAGILTNSFQFALKDFDKVEWRTMRMKDEVKSYKEWIENQVAKQIRRLKDVGMASDKMGDAIKEETKGTLLDQVKHSLAIVKAGTALGSGFLVKMDGKIRLVTNEHVVRGGNPFSATLPDGTMLRFEPTIEVAANRDLVRMTVIGTNETLELAKDMPREGQRIHVFGNSDGGGVLTSLHGTVNGIGPDRIETSGCTFVSGNSGSAVINDNGQVVAVATYTIDLPDLEDRAKQQSRFNAVRWFSVRLNNVKWESISWSDYALRAETLNQLELYEELCRKVCFRDQRLIRKHEVLEWIERERMTNRTLSNALLGVARADEAYLAWKQQWKDLVNKMNEIREHALNDPRSKVIREYKKFPSVLKSCAQARMRALDAGLNLIDGTDWKVSRLKDGGDTGVSAKYYREFFHFHARRFRVFNAKELKGVEMPELPPSLKNRL